MRLTRLEVKGLRVVDSIRLEPAPDLNLLVGENGSGKTSILEAIHLLAHGRSFRSRRIKDVVARGASRLSVYAQLSSTDGVSDSLGIEHGSEGFRIRRSGEAVRNASSLARLLPLVAITPDDQRLLLESSERRRRLLDWPLFHVEPRYLKVYQRFRRSLSQRNAELKLATDAGSLEVWNHEVGQAGEGLHALRAAYFETATALLEDGANRTLGTALDLKYLPGWDTTRPLEEFLAGSAVRDMQRGFTEGGPQRADLRFTVSGSDVRHVLSRGEARLLVITTLLEQARDLIDRTAKQPVILIDDLGSELDAGARAVVMGMVQGLGCQVFISAVREADACSGSWTNRRVFHVERGRVSEVV